MNFGGCHNDATKIPSKTANPKQLENLVSATNSSRRTHPLCRQQQQQQQQFCSSLYVIANNALSANGGAGSVQLRQHLVAFTINCHKRPTIFRQEANKETKTKFTSNITAINSVYVLMVFFVLGVFSTTIATAAVAAIPASQVLRTHTADIMDDDAAQSRLAKRGIDKSDLDEMNLLKYPWRNPCDGTYLSNVTLKRHNRQKVLTDLRSIIAKELGTYEYDSHSAPIFINEIHQFRDEYRCMPRLNIKAKLSLQRWLNQMRINVGAIALELRGQLKWDHLVEQRTMRTSEELQKLLRVERTILCNLELSLNMTKPQRNPVKHKPKYIRKRLSCLKNRMTNIKVPTEGQIGGQRHEPDVIEQRFVKYHTLKYSCRLISSLNVHLRHRHMQLPPICQHVQALKPIAKSTAAKTTTTTTNY